MKNLLVVVLLTGGLSGCSWFGIEGNEGAYLKAEVVSDTRIPEGLDQPRFVNLMVIPEVDDIRQIRGKAFEAGLPEPLSTSFGVDQIVLRKLGNESWIFLDVQPATVWNNVRAFWEGRNIPLEIVDASSGVMETAWLLSEPGTVEESWEGIKKGISPVAQDQGVRHRFRITIEPGVREGSSEVHVIHVNTPISIWPELSDNPELADTALSELAYFLGENINTNSTISLVAGGLHKVRSELVPDVRKPVLKYYLDFNRAWSTVGSALKAARIEIEDLNRSDAIYYVYYDDGSVDEPGFFRRIFTSDDKNNEELVHRYQVRLKELTEEIHVSVYKDEENLADAFLAERLLKMIKEFSS